MIEKIYLPNVTIRKYHSIYKTFASELLWVACCDRNPFQLVTDRVYSKHNEHLQNKLCSVTGKMRKFLHSSVVHRFNRGLR